ncbi:MAG: hypothetical protein ACRDTE_02610 [Pseudonocardiaceae bacterium]
MHTTTTPDPTAPTRDAVHAALLELLTTGQHHHHAATPDTLSAVGDTRRILAAEHGTGDPAGRDAPDERRLAALTQALGETAAALAELDESPWAPDPAQLLAALTELAALTLAWLDTLPPHDPDPWHGDGHENDPHDPSPF